MHRLAHAVTLLTEFEIIFVTLVKTPRASESDVAAVCAKPSKQFKSAITGSSAGQRTKPCLLFLLFPLVLSAVVFHLSASCKQAAH